MSAEKWSRCEAGRALPVRPELPDLPDLGAHLRLQPGLRALPVLLRAARPARADHGRGQGRGRRAAADAGLLRQHRRRRADGAAGLLGAARLLDRPQRRGQVLHQRHQAGPEAGRAARAHRLRRRADLARRRHRRGQRPRARAGLLRHRDPGAGEPGRGRLRPAQDQRGDDAAERRPARRVQGHRRQVRRAAADHPAAPVRAWRRRVGRAAPDRRRSSASSTTGWSRAARACSPATRSSTCPPTARRCPG